MKENDWTESICKHEKMQEFLSKKNLYADVRKRIPYSQEIEGYYEKWEPKYMES